MQIASEMRISGVRDTCEMWIAVVQDAGEMQIASEMQIAGVQDTREMRNASVQDTVESGIAGGCYTGKTILDCFLFFMTLKPLL